MSKRRCYANYPLASIWVWTIPPARLGQLHVFVDREGRVIGYMTWALLTEDVESRLLNGDLSIWQPVEWNRGDRLWIIDFIPLAGRIRTCVRQARQILAGHLRVKFMRRDATGNVQEIFQWSHASSMTGRQIQTKMLRTFCTTVTPDPARNDDTEGS